MSVKKAAIFTWQSSGRTL